MSFVILYVECKRNNSIVRTIRKQLIDLSQKTKLHVQTKMALFHEENEKMFCKIRNILSPEMIKYGRSKGKAINVTFCNVSFKGQYESKYCLASIS